MPPLLLRSDQGRTISVDEGEAQYWINQGYRPSSVREAQADIAAPEQDQGLSGAVRAGVTSALSGATLGLSDVVLGSLASGNEREALLAARRQNPTISTVAEFAGNVVPSVLSGGASAAGRAAALTPAGAVSRLGAGIAERGAEAGLLGKAAAMGAGGAVEGAAALGGSYLAQTALEDKPLSAEAFVGAMGGGALFGGGVGGALGVGSHVLARARSLFPKSEITREAAQAVERDAVGAVQGALDDGRAMQEAAGREIEGMKLRAAEERLAAGAVPDPTAVDQVAPGRLNWALERDAQAARRGRRAFAQAPEAAPLEPSPGLAAGSEPPPPPLSGTVEAPLPVEVRDIPPPPGRAPIGGDTVPGARARGLPASDPEAVVAPPSPARGGTAERAVFDTRAPALPDASPLDQAVLDAARPPRDLGGLADRAVFDFSPPPSAAPPIRRTVPWQEIEAGRAPAMAEAVDVPSATAVGRRPARAVADEILAPPAAAGPSADIDAALRRVARSGGFDLAPALEPVVPRGATGPALSGGTLEARLQEMARLAEAGVPLPQMRAAASGIPDEAISAAGRAHDPGPMIPSHDTLAAKLDALGEDYVEQVLPARQIADRGYYEPPGGHADAVRAANARAAIRDGQREAIKLGVSEEGKILVMDGRHRLAAAIEADAPIRVKWTTAFEPAEHDVFRAGRGGGGVDDIVATAAAPRSAVADLAEHALTNANPKAAKILDAARKEAATRAEVERMFNQQAGASAETAVGRRAAAADAARPGSGTIPWRELEAMKLRGEAPAPVLPGSKAQPIPDFDALIGPRALEGVLGVASTEEIAKRGWYDASSLRARKAFKEDLWGTPGDANLTPARLEAGRKVASNVRARPSVFDLYVSPDGHLVLSSSHKPEVFAAMLELGGDLQVRWRPWTVWMNEGAPKAVDVLRPLDGLVRDDFVRWGAARERGFSGSLREFMDAAGGGRRAGLGSEIADEVRLAAGPERPQGSAWIPLLTPEGEVVGRAPILDDIVPGTVAARKGVAAGSGRPALADQILGAQGSAPPLDDQIATALGKRVGNMVPMGDDIAEAARKINAHEEALADLAEALGDAAPPAAVSRAAQFRAAQAAHADAVGAAQAHAAQQIEDNLHTVVEEVNSARVNAAIDKDVAKAARQASARESATGPARQLGGAAADIGAGLEVLKAMGVAVPDVERIPVIGPVLGMYLKARAALGIWKRAGGAVPQSIEGLIASKGAKTKDRVANAMARMLEIGERGARKAQPATGAIGTLGYRLFPGSEQAPRARARGAEDPLAQYHARMDELARAAQPGAIERSVAERIPTADPALRDAVTVAVRRKLNYIDSQAPRPPLVPALFQADGGWRPSAQKLESFARTIAAAEDPAGVLEDVAAGRGVSIEAANTLRNVYPGLYAKAQSALAQAAPQLQGKVPYSRAVSLRVLFDVPTDATTTPEHVRFLQQGSPSPAPPAGRPGAPSTPAAPPTPSIAGPVSVGDRTMTRLDQRAGR